MAPSRLAHHLPALFGPSRRAAWRWGVLRRGLAALALLLALHLTLGATRTDPHRPAPTRTDPPDDAARLGGTGPALSLPLAAPADHLAPGDEVGVYLPGRSEPLVRGARVLGSVDEAGGTPALRITLRRSDIGPLLREMGPERGGGTGFVVVRDG